MMDLIDEENLPEWEALIGNMVDGLLSQRTPEISLVPHHVFRELQKCNDSNYVLGVFKPDLIESVIERLRWSIGVNRKNLRWGGD